LSGSNRFKMKAPAVFAGAFLDLSGKRFRVRD
jgi:hypothetical protein